MKKLNLQFVSLELADEPADSGAGMAGLQVLANLNLEKLETLCQRFHDEMKDNRISTDDGRMGLNVLEDIKGRRYLRKQTRKQLLAWCHTDGSVYQRGVELAQEICREVYGRVPTREEVKLVRL